MLVLSDDVRPRDDDDDDDECSRKVSRLFRVLVTGGSMLALTACSGKPTEDPPGGDSGGGARGSDAAASSDAPFSDGSPADAGNAGDAAQQPCFCNTTPEKCCDSELKTARPGFYCCWATSCP